MKCASLWNPWAILCLIASLADKSRAVKPFETRSWATSYRGKLLIHAAKRFTKAESDICFQEPFMSVLMSAGVMQRTEDPDRITMTFARGCIIGMVDLVECYEVVHDGDGVILSEAYGHKHSRQLPTGDELAFGDFSVGRYAWKLANPIRFAKPIPFPGRQQLFNVPDEVVAEQIAEARAA